MNSDFNMENELMSKRERKVRTLWSRLVSGLAVAVFSLVVAAYVRPTFAQTSATKTFSSAEEATTAVFQAAQSGDERQLEATLGTGKDVTSSGDEVEDKLEREQFVEKYQQMHRLVREADGYTILYIGAENWPFPVPLVSSNGVWHFDSDAGRREILFRTVGENESTAIEVCDAFAAITKQGSASKGEEDPIKEYAQKLGQLWSGDTAGTTADSDSPFQGYYFQTKKVPGRVLLVAYPAKYRSSGIMTFLLMQDGVVYGKDLGRDSTKAALKVHSLDSSWHPTQ